MSEGHFRIRFSPVFLLQLIAVSWASLFFIIYESVFLQVNIVIVEGRAIVFGSTGMGLSLSPFIVCTLHSLSRLSLFSQDSQREKRVLGATRDWPCLIQSGHSQKLHNHYRTSPRNSSHNMLFHFESAPDLILQRQPKTGLLNFEYCIGGRPNQAVRIPLFYRIA